MGKRQKDRETNKRNERWKTKAGDSILFGAGRVDCEKGVASFPF